jgi:DNA-binding SARP family transcriptional activator
LRDAGIASGGTWETLEQAAESLHRDANEATVLLIIDDFHQLLGTEAEQVLERLISYMPERMAILIGSRRVPTFNIARARLADRLLEVGQNDLRFRTWEVEELFHHHYGERLSPEQVAELTRKTEGWAAGLQFFRLAIRGKPPRERSRLLAEFDGGSAMFRDFLARDVLADLPPDLREFMIRTSPLGWMTASLCDAFLGTTDARAHLAEAERRQVFTQSVGADAYRYHEVLRSHLEDALQEQLGDHVARNEHHRAAVLLEDADRVPEAVRAYCRAEDWSAVSRLADERGENDSLGGLPAGGALPAALAGEPWALLSQARALVRSGRLHAAIDRYGEAERGFGAARGAETCRRERVAVSSWVERIPAPLTGWVADLRRATMKLQSDSIDIPQHAGALTAGDRLVIGVTFLLAGRTRAAREQLAAVADDSDSNGLIPAVGQLVCALAGFMEGDPSQCALSAWAVEQLETDVNWLAQLGWTIVEADTSRAVEDADTVRQRCRVDGNEWGGALAAIVEAELWLHHPTPDLGGPVGEALADAVATFDRLGAGVLAACAEADRSAVLAAMADPTAAHAARGADRRAVVTGCDLARVRARSALEVAGRADQPQVRFQEALAGGSDVDLHAHWPIEARSTVITAAGLPSIEIKCFGGLSVMRDGRATEVTAVKPRARSLLRLLAVHTGRTVHREAIIEALWPEADPDTGTRSLQVAASAVRQLLEPGVGRGSSSFVVRDGDGYLLALPPGSSSDVAIFTAAMTAGRNHLRHDHAAEAADAFARALDVYAGELLPEEGAAEWVVKERHHLQMDAADAASAVAEHLAEQNDVSGAIQMFGQCLTIDPYRDSIWRRLISLAAEAGDRAVASSAQRRYDAILIELGVP